MKRSTVFELVLAAMFTAMGVVLPVVFHFFNLGWTFLPMHIPILLCGLICGYKMGGICGLITPFISCLATGMPSPMFPSAVTMMAELCVYGVVTGFLAKRTNYIIALITAMIAGRAVSLFLKLAIAGVSGNEFVFGVVMNSLFVTVWPGILIQLIFIPTIMMTLKRAKLIPIKNRM